MPDPTNAPSGIPWGPIAGVAAVVGAVFLVRRYAGKEKAAKKEAAPEKKGGRKPSGAAASAPKKGSAEAREKMAELRAKRGAKKGSAE